MSDANARYDALFQRWIAERDPERSCDLAEELAPIDVAKHVIGLRKEIAALTARAEAAERELHECRVVGYTHGYMAKEPVHEWLARRLAYLEPRSERTSIAEAARAELERRARVLLAMCQDAQRGVRETVGTRWFARAINALAELLPASAPKRGSMPCVYCHGTGAECTRCDGTGTQPEGEKPCAVCGSYEHRRHHG